MDHELKLTKANRLRLAAAFRNHKRVDCSIDCAIEDQMGRAFVDNPAHPSAYRITVGPFWYFAGDAHSPGGLEMMKGFPAYNLFMPSPNDWLDVAREIFSESLVTFPRYRFSSEKLSLSHLESLLANSNWKDKVVSLDRDLAARFSSLPENPLELSDFDLVEDFLERGLAYTCLDMDKPMGVAYSSLVWSRGIEVSVFVEEKYRRMGLATALAGRLLIESLRRGLRPNWDAANPESCKLAEKLGFVFVESYNSYYHTMNRPA